MLCFVVFLLPLFVVGFCCCLIFFFVVGGLFLIWCGMGFLVMFNLFEALKGERILLVGIFLTGGSADFGHTADLQVERNSGTTTAQPGPGF